MAKGFPDWLRAIALIGLDEDGNPLLIRVDDDGRLEIPLKGVHGGELVTVAVDENGNLNAYMLDDESQHGYVIRVGNAELAARLGSAVTWDWRGKVQIIHDFSKGYQSLEADGYGTGAEIALDPSHSQFGGYSAKMTGGSDGAGAAVLSGYASPYPTRFVGVACNFSVEQAPESVILFLGIWKSGSYTSYGIRYLFADHKLQYLDSENTYQDIATYKIYRFEDIFYRMKLVADLETRTYERAMFGDQEYPLTAAAWVQSTPTFPDYTHYSFLVYSDDGENDIVYCDHMILTSSEPENI